MFDIVWEKDGRVIKVPVKLHTELGNYEYKDSEKSFYFSAVHKPSHMNLTNTDAEELKKAVQEHLDKWIQLSWQMYMLVKIDGGRKGQYDNNFEIGIDVDFYVIGTYEDNDSVVHMQVPQPEKLPKTPGEKIEDFNRWGAHTPNEGWPESKYKHVSRYWHSEKNPTTAALIPATQASYDALMVFYNKLQQLLDNMHDFFNPASICETILKLAEVGPALLPPAPKKKKGRKKKK